MIKFLFTSYACDLMFDQFCIEFSGGKDSTALLFKMLEKGKHIDKVIRVDFELDYPELLKHIADVEK